MNFTNSIKVIKALINGKSIAPIQSFYDKRYPPTKFFKYNLPEIYIQCIMCGFPRSGTHWIRNVIEKSTGQKTGDLYSKKPSPLDKQVIIVKIHARSKSIAYLKALWLLPRFKFGGKYIYVYRDPRDAIISLYEMYKNAKEMDDLQTDEFLKIYDPIRQFRWEIKAWVFPDHKNVFLVKYEDLKLFPEKGFERIFNYLGLNASLAEESIGKLVATSDSKKRPRGIAYAWKDAPSEYEYIIECASKQLKSEIKILGYEEA